jgi:phage major head subunit gpT-like protein
VCYDGQYFFDTDHTEGENTTNQSNSISVDISTLGTAVHGADAAHPSVEEMQQSILLAIQAIIGFKDDVNEPMNENAKAFLVMVPTSLWTTAEAAVQSNLLANAVNIIPQIRNVTIEVEMNARLNAWTDKFAVFRTDGAVKPLIRQEETGVQLKAKAEGSDFEFDNDAHQYGVDCWRNVGYGYWQHACLVTMT